MIREKYPLVPIIFFSSKKEEEDIIAALEMGVDSYITKPFSLNVFKAQVIASLNRARMIRKQLNVYKKEELQVGDFRFDYGRYQLFKKGFTYFIVFERSSINSIFSGESRASIL